MGKKLTYEEVKEHIESFGYKLKSDYINSISKIKLECPNGHEFETTFSLFKHQNIRCHICSGNVRYSQEDIINYLHSIGYDLVSGEYKNNQTKLLHHFTTFCIKNIAQGLSDV